MMWSKLHPMLKALADAMGMPPGIALQNAGPRIKLSQALRGPSRKAYSRSRYCPHQGARECARRAAEAGRRAPV